MKVGTVIRKRISTKRFFRNWVNCGEVENKGAWDVPRSRFVAISCVGRESRGKWSSGGLLKKSNHIGCAILLQCLEFRLMDSHFGVPKKIVDVGSVKYVLESAISMALPLVQVSVIKVTKGKSRIHFVAGRSRRKRNTCNGTEMLARNNSS